MPCRPPKRLRIILRTRAFSTTPTPQRLGAQTYAQEWQTGSYHFNKSHTKTLPVAAKRTDELLTNWMTQQKRRSGQTEQLLRNAITTQRRKTDTVLVSHSTAKDYGDRVEVTAFVYDGAEAAEQEDERRRLARKGVKPEESGGKRGPVRKRRGPVRPGDGTGAGGGFGGAGAGGARRVGGQGQGGGLRNPGIRRLTPGAPGGAAGFGRPGGMAGRGGPRAAGGSPRPAAGT